MGFESLGAGGVDSPPLTTHEWVRDRLRQEIYDGVQRPGSRVVQTEIAERYDVSVTPVREAMRDLASEGLITARAHKAATVRELDADEAVEINDIRALLELRAVQVAAEKLTDAEFTRLEALHEAMVKHPYQSEWVPLNDQFHLVIIDATHSPNLIGILRNLRTIARFYFEAALRADGADYDKRNREHRALIDSLRARDADAASEIMSHHLSNSDGLRRRLLKPLD